MKTWMCLAGGEFCRGFSDQNKAKLWEKNYHSLSEILNSIGIDLMSFELPEELQKYFGMEMLNTADEDITIRVEEID